MPSILDLLQRALPIILAKSLGSAGGCAPEVGGKPLIKLHRTRVVVGLNGLGQDNMNRNAEAACGLNGYRVRTVSDAGEKFDFTICSPGLVAQLLQCGADRCGDGLWFVDMTMTRKSDDEARCEHSW